MGDIMERGKDKEREGEGRRERRQQHAREQMSKQ
jgi:hypothetical protein